MSKIRKGLALILAIVMLVSGINVQGFSTALAANPDAPAATREIIGNKSVSYDGEPVTFGKTDSDFNYNGEAIAVWYKLNENGTVGGDLASNYSVVEDAPMKAGSYAVTAYTAATDQHSKPFYFDIEKAVIKLKWPEKIAKVYNQDAIFNVNLEYLGGLVGNDAKISNPRFTAKVTVANEHVGIKPVVAIERFAAGIDLSNYQFEENAPTEAQIVPFITMFPSTSAEPGEISAIDLPQEPVRPENGTNVGMTIDQQETSKEAIRESFAEMKNINTKKPEPSTNSEHETARTEENILNAVNRNSYIKFNVETKSIDRNDNPAEADAIAAALDTDMEIYQYGDIKVSVQSTEQNKMIYEMGELNSLAKPLSFTVMHPENTEEADWEQFGVAVVVDGKAEILPETSVKFDHESKSVSFKTDKFGTFAVFKKGEEKPSTEVNPDDTAKPDMVEKVRVKTDHDLLKVTFNTSNEELDCYRIAIRQAGKDWVYINTTNNSRLINKLYKKPLVRNAKYEVKVAAVANKETNLRSDYTAIRTAYTNRIGNKPSVMPTPKFKTIKSNKGTATVTVKKVNYTSLPKNIEYKISYKVKGAKNWQKSKYTLKNVKTIKGLKKGKTYSFAVTYRYKSPLDGKTYIYSETTYKNAKIK